MSDKDVDKEFRRIVDSFIHLANEHSGNANRENVSMALLYAAARFNAFIVASQAPDLKKFESDREAAFEFFLGEYKKMLKENLDDYRKTYGEGLAYAHLMKKH